MKEALVFWFTGLSGSGKTTVATGVEKLLKTQGYSVLILDGDNVRMELHKHLDFTEDDVKENNTLIVQLCRKHRKDYDIILVPIISPYRESRVAASAILGDGFYEIHFSADIETVVKRDVKGLYAKAKNNEIVNLIGYSPGAVYEAPQRPDLVLDTKNETSEESVNKFHSLVIKELKRERE